MNKVIDLEIRPVGGGIKTLNDGVKELKKNIENATDTADVEKLNKALKQTEGEIEDINKAIDGFDLHQKFDDVYEGIAPLSSRLGELEDRMYELAFAGKANTDEFRLMQAEAINMRQTIISVDKQVDIMADNQGLAVFGEGLASVGDSLLRMDFDTASKQAQTLAMNAGKISFGEAVKSVKQLGQTFVSLGKAIITNPIFLIATVIGLIVVGIVKLLDKLGFLKVMFDAIGSAIDWVVQQLKDFLDWIGLTDFASEDAAQNTIDRNKRIIESEKAKGEIITDGYDHEIRMAKIAGEDTTKLEKKRLKDIKKRAKDQVNMNLQIVKSVKMLHGAESDEFKEAMKTARESVLAFREASQEIEAFDAQVVADKKKRDDDKAKEDGDKRKDAIAKAKQFAQDRLNAERLIEDLRNEMIEDDVERELALSETKYNRLIEDTKKSITLTEQEKLVIIEAYGVQRETAEDKIRQKIIDQERAMNDEIAKILKQSAEAWAMEEEMLMEEIYQMTLTDQQREVIAVQDKYFQLIEMAKQHGLDTALLEEEQAKAIDDIDKKYFDEEVARQEALKAKKLAQFGEVMDAGSNVLNSLSALNDAAMEAQLAGAEGNEKKQEQIRKKAFERNKALQISMAVMSGIQGVVNALTAQSVIPEPFGTILKAVNAVVIGATTVANIAKIKSTKYTGSGGGGGGTGTTGSVGSSASSQMPNISMFGQSNDLNSLTSAKSVESQPVVKAVVVESDITQTQQRVRTIEERSAL